MAHSDLELKVTPLHLFPISKAFLLFMFKSEFCPFSKLEHDRFTCPFAHNWQDFKRPFNPYLIAEQCMHWDKSKEIQDYLEGCPNG